MVFNPNIPQGTDAPSASQSQLLTNFQQVNTIFALNHYAFNDATAGLRGMHRAVVLEAQAAGPATSATQGALYSKIISGQPNLVWRRLNSGPEIQMTSNLTPIIAATGYTMIPGGLVLQWGTVHVAGGSSANIPFPLVFGAVPYSITVTTIRSAGAGTMNIYVLNGSVTATKFQTESTGGAHDIYWMAIGKAA